MENNHTKTSDLAFAAYLMLHDFTVIGCIDPENGEGRYDFYLTHSDPDVREAIHEQVIKLRDQFASTDFKYADYYRHTRFLRRKAANPVRKSQWQA